MGDWLHTYGETIYGSRGGGFPEQSWGLGTRKGNKFYLHVIKTPQTPYLFLPEFKSKVTTAVKFEDRKVLKFKQQPEGLFVYLEGMDANKIDQVIELTVE